MMMAIWSWADVKGVKPPKPAVSKRPYTRSDKIQGRREALPKDFIRNVQKCADEGLSAAEAGAVLGRTRNAVLGCAFRNGIKFKGKRGPKKKGK